MALAETWEWDGSQWTLRATGGPAPRWGHILAYDTARARTVLHGGRDSQQGTVLSDTWEWDGVAWIRRIDGPPRWAAGAAFDAYRSYDAPILVCALLCFAGAALSLPLVRTRIAHASA